MNSAVYLVVDPKAGVQFCVSSLSGRGLSARNVVSEHYKGQEVTFFGGAYLMPTGIVSLNKYYNGHGKMRVGDNILSITRLYPGDPGYKDTPMAQSVEDAYGKKTLKEVCEKKESTPSPAPTIEGNFVPMYSKEGKIVGYKEL